MYRSNRIVVQRVSRDSKTSIVSFYDYLKPCINNLFKNLCELQRINDADSSKQLLHLIISMCIESLETLNVVDIKALKSP